MTGIEDQDIPGVLFIRAPKGRAVPLVFDSPHSGFEYPDDFGAAAPLKDLRQAEDMFVDDLYATAPDHGAAFLGALFPRVYIDPNRIETDLDPAQLDGTWGGPPLAPSEKATLGQSLIWTRYPPGLPVYDRKLTPAEAQHRIETYHRPYHAALKQLLDATYERHGVVYHINCHSVPAIANDMSAEPPGTPRPDFILGSRDGTTTGPELTETVRAFLAGRGYAVRVNEWFKGVEIVRRSGDPANGRHSLQIEINRRLYMDETKLQKSRDYSALATVITGLINELRDFAATTAPRL